MKMLYVASLFSALLGLSPAAHADICGGGDSPAKQLIATSITTAGTEQKQIYLLLDSSGGMIGMQMGGSNYCAKDLMSSKGSDLNIHGHSGVMVARAFNVIPSSSATLRLTYDTDLAPFLGSKKNVDLSITRDGDGKWHLLFQGRSVNRLLITPASRGIANVSPDGGQAMAALEPMLRKSLQSPDSGHPSQVDEEQELAKNVPTSSSSAKKAIDSGDDGLLPTSDRAAI